MCGWKNTSAGAITAAAPKLFVTKSSPNLANRHSTSFPPTDSSFFLITMKTNRPTSIPRVQTLFQAFAPLIALATAPTLRTAKASWLALLALTAALIVAPGLIACF